MRIPHPRVKNLGSSHYINETQLLAHYWQHIYWQRLESRYGFIALPEATVSGFAIFTVQESRSIVTPDQLFRFLQRFLVWIRSSVSLTANISPCTTYHNIHQVCIDIIAEGL
jgi:hypothetical protein